MKFTILLSKKTFIYYSIIGLPIIIGSFYNLVDGLILQKNSGVHIGAFSLFGFILIPLGLFWLYFHNKCIITTDGMRIGKIFYEFSKHNFQIIEKELPFKDRPIFSTFKKKYYDLIIREINTNKVIFEKDLDVFQKDIEKIKNLIPYR